MLNSIPQKKTVDGQNDSHKQSPPYSPVFKTPILLLLVRRQKHVRPVPNDPLCLFRGGRSGEQGNRDHNYHTENPGAKGAMIKSVEFSEQFFLEQNPAEDESRDNCRQCGGAVGAFPQNAKCEYDSKRRCD